MSRFLSRLALGCSVAALPACSTSELEDDVGSSESAITDVIHSTVERQSIGNCWLYAQASWVESMNLAATGDELDVSQTYWTYWHWFDQVTGFAPPTEIETGGFQFTANQIVLDRGLMHEGDFVPADTTTEMSARQQEALTRINEALAAGELTDVDGRRVREIFDEAWGLSAGVRAQLDQAFGADGESTLHQGASLSGTDIIDPADVPARFTARVSGQTTVREETLIDAIDDWRNARYPSTSSSRREFLRRVQRALHDRQPVVITWDVDFNALENLDEERRGSFNLETLADNGGPGRQGGHMTVLEDYAAETEEFGLLEAGVTLDPTDAADREKLDAALLDSTRVTLLRVKNSWGKNRPDREFAPGFPGYHDLRMDYLNGPIRWCPDVEDKTEDNCLDESIPLNEVLLPPGY